MYSQSSLAVKGGVKVSAKTKSETGWQREEEEKIALSLLSDSRRKKKQEGGLNLANEMQA